MLFLTLNRGKLHDDKKNLMYFQLAIIFIHWIKLYPYQIRIVQEKAYLSSGELLNNHIYPVDRSCPLDRWFIQWITLSTALNNLFFRITSIPFDNRCNNSCSNRPVVGWSVELCRWHSLYQSTETIFLLFLYKFHPSLWYWNKWCVRLSASY